MALLVPNLFLIFRVKQKMNFFDVLIKVKFLGPNKKIMFLLSISNYFN